ncbi:MAG: molybdopterin biosynthesis protein [Candidatus Njordarchaeales archaeon]
MRKIFRKLVSVEEAKEIFLKFFTPRPVGVEEVELLNSLNRVLAEDVIAQIDVPAFDRTIVDGYAVRAEDVFAASETNPVKLRVIERVRTGFKPSKRVERGLASEVDTGAEIPPGANAVVPIEYTEEEGEFVLIYRRVSPGANIQYAGSDIGRGEVLLRKGYLLTPRDIGVLAALGYSRIRVYRKPRVGIISIGDELQLPGTSLSPGRIYDVNTYTLATSVMENGGDPVIIGIAKDDPDDIREKIKKALETSDLVISSGSSSAGYSDMLYRIINEFGEPGVLVHGVKSKPGKPVILAVVNNKPFFGLPGFPTSSLTAFRTFVEPILRRMAGLKEFTRKELSARITRRALGEAGRRVYKTVSIHKVHGETIAYPLPTISGAITTLANAEGFFEIPENESYLQENSIIKVKIFDEKTQIPDLVIMGPRSTRVEKAISLLINENPGVRIKYVKTNPLLAVDAVLRGEADIACVNIFDPSSNRYNEHLVRKDELSLVKGFTREISIVTASDKEAINNVETAVEKGLRLANREKGSNYRVLLDLELMKLANQKNTTFNELIEKVPGYYDEYRTVSSAIIAVETGKADYCIAPTEIAEMYNVNTAPFAEESFDFIVRKDTGNPLVTEFFNILNEIR